MDNFDSLNQTNVFKDVFRKYCNIYECILSKLYPSLNSVGFQERNMSVNFSKAYESIYPNAISWFEFLILPNNHIDLLIVDNSDSNKRIILVESKRYTSKTKEESINNDIKRMEDVVKKKLINDMSAKKHNVRIKDIDLYKFYGIMLIDVWDENNTKKSFLDSFDEEEKHSFSNKNCNESINNEYHLLYKAWEISN